MTLYELVQTNLVLFTSTGLWGLTLNNRYTHAVTRLREFYDKKCDMAELEIMLDRCFLLKWSFMFLILSVLIGIFHAVSMMFQLPQMYSTIVVFGYCMSLFGSMLLLLFDVIKSFNATLIHLKE